MTHYFDIDHAEKFGVNAAILLHNLIHWINHNKTTNTNFHDGYWTDNSLTARTTLFPYLSKKQIRTVLDVLQNAGLNPTSKKGEG